MTGKTHFMCSVAAASAWAVGARTFELTAGVEIVPWLTVPAVAVGAYMPDIDIAQSRLGNTFRIFSSMLTHRGITHTLLIPTLLLIAIPFMSSKKVTIITILLFGLLFGLLFNSKLKKGRGNLLNKLKNLAKGLKGLIIVIVFIPLSFMVGGVGASIVYGLAVGWLLHMLEDMFNDTGIPLFWPVTKKRIHIPVLALVKTRHWTEAVFLMVWLGGCAIWVLTKLAGN